MPTMIVHLAKTRLLFSIGLAKTRRQSATNASTEARMEHQQAREAYDAIHKRRCDLFIAFYTQVRDAIDHIYKVGRRLIVFLCSSCFRILLRI